MLDVILGEGGFLEQRAFLSLRDKQVKHLVNDIFKFNLPPPLFATGAYIRNSATSND